MSEKNKPKYYKPENAKYTMKWDKENTHKILLKYVNWQYDIIKGACDSIDMLPGTFVRLAVAEKLERMGIDIYDKGGKEEND